MENKNIVFLRTPVVYPPGSNRVNAPMIPPLGMGIVTAALRNKGYSLFQDDLNIKVAHQIFEKKFNLDLNSVRNCDDVIDYIEDRSNVFDLYSDSILSLSNLDSPDMILLSAPNSLYDQSALRILLVLCKYLKKKYNVPIIVGSESDHIHFITEYAMREGLFDYMISGPGELSMPELLGKIFSGEQVNDIPGLCYLDQDRVVFNKEGSSDVKIQPDFDGLPLDLYRWNYFGDENILILPVRTSFGCPNNCAFCISSKCKEVKVLSAKSSVKQIIELSKKYNTKHFMFLNNYFNISRSYAEEFCRELIEQNADILWSDCAYEKNLDYDLLKLMKKSGCIRLILGFETGSARLLDDMGKKIDLHHLEEVFRWSHELGIWNGIEVIVGLPNEGQDDLDQTILFLKNNENYIDELYVNRFRAIRGSALANNPKKFGLLNFKFIQGKEFLRAKGYFEVSGASYDEVARSWNEKKRYIENAEAKVRRMFQNKTFMLWQEQLNILFMLYSKYNTKEEVRTAYDYISKKEYLKMVFNPKSIAWQIRNAGSFSNIMRKVSGIFRF